MQHSFQFTCFFNFGRFAFVAVVIQQFVQLYTRHSMVKTVKRQTHVGLQRRHGNAIGFFFAFSSRHKRQFHFPQHV